MRLRFSIGAKIFGLAIFLLCLTIALAGFLLVQVTRLNAQLRVIAERDVPLSDALHVLDEYGLRQRLAFERWFGALNAAEPNAETIAEATGNHAFFTDATDRQLTKLDQLIRLPVARDTDRETMDGIRASLRHYGATAPLITQRQKELLDLQMKGEHARADELLTFLNDQQRTLQNQRHEMDRDIAAVLTRATGAARERELSVFWLTIAATVALVALGLTVAAFITRRLVEPMRSLVSGMKSVEAGQLDVELPVTATDEIGVLTGSFNYFVRELRAKEQMKATFGKYIDPRVLDQVILLPGASPEALVGRREMSVSFADLVGFSGLSEELTPAGLVALLNRHFGLQAEAIQAERGVVDKFIGDCVMAFFGPPFTAGENHALLACQAALRQVQAMETMRAQLPELTGRRKNLPVIDVRIGVATGELVVGNIGSENTRSFTVMGDTVNLASRLEGVNRQYGTRIMINETTANEAGAAIVVREIDALTVKGKTEPSRVFELLGLAGAVAETKVQLCAEFHDALAAYRAQRWADAEAAWQRCLVLAPDDGPSQIFLRRCAELRANPPSADWDGVWQLVSK